MNYENHERHEIHGTHEAHGNRHSPEQRGPRKPFRLRIESPLDAETEAVITRTIGCAIAVHTALGPGFLESIYKRAMRIELDAQRLPYECERAVSVAYRGVEIRGQRIDLIVENRVVVELKAVTRLDPIHEAQTISYLRTNQIARGASHQLPSATSATRIAPHCLVSRTFTCVAPEWCQTAFNAELRVCRW